MQVKLAIPFVHVFDHSCMNFFRNKSYDKIKEMIQMAMNQNLQIYQKENIHTMKSEKTTQSDIKKYSVISNVFFWFRYYWKHVPISVILIGVEVLLSAVLPLVGIYLPKLTIDLLLGNASTKDMLLVLGVFGFLLALLYGISTAISQGNYFKLNGVRDIAMGDTFLKSLRISYEIPESEWGKNIYQKALKSSRSGDWSAISRTLFGTTSLIENLLSFLLYSTVLSTLNIWCVIILLALSALNCIVMEQGIKLQDKIRDTEAVHYKHWNYVKAAMGNTTAAKDIRIFDMNKWLVGLRDKTINEIKGDRKILHKMQIWQETMNFLIALVRDVVAYGYLIYMVTTGAIAVSDFVLYFGAVTGFSNFVTAILQNIGELKSAGNETNYFRAYMNLPDEELNEGNRQISELSFPIKIEFRDVSFSYKAYGKETMACSAMKIFDHFNLTIKSGERLALVGVNGAGKTTFVKLLCGLYEPDGGQILVNDINIKEFPKREWYDLISVVFQDQLVLPITIAENISLQKREKTDDKKANTALEKAGLTKTFADRGITLDSYMKKLLTKKGIELSGGQQQRLILARALYKDAPLLILDEPTSALDPIAESEIYESYLKYTQKKTAIFISHRLASTRFSDRIVMLEGGKIIEEGTHDQLMQANGPYANMYAVQSSYYKNTDSSNNANMTEVS